MQLTSVLNPQSVPGFYSGTLGMAFSQANDWDPANGGWNIGNPLAQTYGLTPNVSVAVNLSPSTDPAHPGQLGLGGSLALTFNGGLFGQFGPVQTQMWMLEPGATPPGVVDMAMSGTGSGWQAGFWLDVPWDSQGAVCQGLWWFIWSAATPSAPSNPKIGISVC